MEKLRSTCKNLETFVVKYAEMNSIDSNDLPRTIFNLKLIRCEIPVRFFSGCCLTNLVYVDLSDSSRVCAVHIRDLTLCSNNLETLKLSRCYRIDDNLINILFDNNVKNLKILDLEGIPNITSITLQDIFSKYVKINHNFKCLNIKNCPKVIIDPFKELLEKTDLNLIF